MITDESQAESKREVQQNEWVIAIKGVKGDLRERWLPDITMTVLSATFGGVIGYAMSTTKGIIYGAAIGLTVAIWIIAFLMISHIPSGESIQQNPDAPVEPNIQSQNNENKAPNKLSSEPDPPDNKQLRQVSLDNQTQRQPSSAPQQENQNMSDEKPNSKEQRPSISQSMTNSPGGIQAGGDVHITNLPDPKIAFRLLRENEPSNDQYRTEILLTIDSKVALNNLSIRVDSPTITEMEVSPQRAGLFIGGPSGVREGYAFANIPSAYGTYIITVLTKSRSTFNLTYDF